MSGVEGLFGNSTWYLVHMCHDSDDCCGSDECFDFEEWYGSVEGCEYNYILVLNFIVDCVYFVFF